MIILPHLIICGFPLIYLLNPKIVYEKACMFMMLHLFHVYAEKISIFNFLQFELKLLHFIGIAFYLLFTNQCVKKEF